MNCYGCTSIPEAMADEVCPPKPSNPILNLGLVCPAFPLSNLVVLNVP
ncbi:hypothetical protein CK203_068478 [Vitis vinifera]|uniref:Uncharacterized protein n=1 Tax=Vitis vinifera TaxID=29760 RepID=A0A438F2Y2_VITVI|nr:hypothetical protein CK203_068478 [Vitis vinifera]